MKTITLYIKILIFFLLGITLGGCTLPDIGSAFIDLEEKEYNTENNRLYSEAGSSLVMSIPNGLSIEQEYISKIYDYANQVSHCQNSSDDPIPIVLAEACVLYDTYYLFPDYLPNSLDTILDTETYVAHMQQSDPFTFYYSPENFADYKSFRDGDLAHIGFSYRLDSEIVSEQTPLLIMEIYPFTRAWIDGLQSGDKVIAINGLAISGFSREYVIDLFPNQEGEAVDLLVERNSQDLMISTAAEEHIALLLAPGVAYLNVRSFILNTGEEVKNDFQKLQQVSPEPIASIILDLRDNTGGSTAGALQLIDYLIDQDLPAQTNPIMIQDGTYHKNVSSYLGDYESTDIGNFSETTFVVLVDAYTASAGEITAAALQYYDEATLMGVQTYGKGVSQFVFELVDGSGVWITSHYVYSPGEESFHQVGLSPDIIIADTPTSFSQDPLLDKAIIFLQTGEVADRVATRKKLGHLELRKSGIDPFLKRIMDRYGSWR